MPPRKRLKVDKHITIRFVLSEQEIGVLISKKNKWRPYCNYRRLKNLKKGFVGMTPQEIVTYLDANIKAFIRNDTSYTILKNKAIPVITRQAQVFLEKYKKYGISFPLVNPVSISVYHYFKNNMRRDLSNKFDSLADLLVSASILTNDCWQKMSPVFLEAENYHGEILGDITEVSISIKLFDEPIPAEILEGSEEEGEYEQESEEATLQEPDSDDES